MIVGNNSILNQYAPVFKITKIVDGQILVYSSAQKAFVNQSVLPGTTPGTTIKLGELFNVSDAVDSPAVPNGQALVYNSLTKLWTNSAVDYNLLINTPTSATYTFAGLSDVASPVIPNAYLKWNATGTQVTYVNDIPVTDIQGLATVATTGSYNDLIDKPILLTSVSGVGTQGVTVSVATSTTTPVITVGLGDITPTSVTATGAVTGTNLSGTNTGDQTIVLGGDVTGTGTGAINVQLKAVNATPGIYGSENEVPVLTINDKGLVIASSKTTYDTLPPDVIPASVTYVVNANKQMVLTGQLEVDGAMTLSGILAII